MAQFGLTGRPASNCKLCSTVVQHIITQFESSHHSLRTKTPHSLYVALIGCLLSCSLPVRANMVAVVTCVNEVGVVQQALLVQLCGSGAATERTSGVTGQSTHTNGQSMCMHSHEYLVNVSSWAQKSYATHRGARGPGGVLGMSHAGSNAQLNKGSMIWQKSCRNTVLNKHLNRQPGRVSRDPTATSARTCHK